MRLSALLTAVALISALAAPAAAAEPTSQSLTAQVTALQAEVDSAGRELEAGARAWEQGTQRLAALTQQQFAVQGQLEDQDLATTRSRTGVSALVRAAYKGGGLPPTVSALLSGDPRALSDLARVRRTVDHVDTSRRSALHALTASRVGTERLLTDRTRLRREALAAQQALDARQQRVADDARALSARLTATAQALQAALGREAEAARAAADARAAAAARAAAERSAAVTGYPMTDYVPGAVTPSTGGGCAPAAVHGYANGFLPDEVLCPVPGHPGQRLRTDAAQSFAALDAARGAAGLPGLCITDSYRDYAGQIDVFARKPQLAAVPGRSQHGWGLALDLGCGAASFDSEVYGWLSLNAPRFGWLNPGWAQRGGSKPEPWHWEFQG